MAARSMVDLTLSEEQEMLKELAHEFARDSVRPMAEHWDENSEFPMEAIAEAHELGLMNLHIPEEYGGMGFGCLTEAVVQERLAWGDPGFATAAYSNGLTAAPIITERCGRAEAEVSRLAGRKAVYCRLCSHRTWRRE